MSLILLHAFASKPFPFPLPVTRSRDDEMDAEEFIDRLTPTVLVRGTAAAAAAEPLLRWFRTLCTRILDEPHPDVVALEQKYNPERDLNKVGSG